MEERYAIYIDGEHLGYDESSYSERQALYIKKRLKEENPEADVDGRVEIIELSCEV
tara:strand:- start:471 stop:638 length:168 start_codon:yes stop_codon:yes gene_type:complete